MAEKNTEKQRAAEQQFAEIAKISDEELFKRLATGENGLNQVEAGDRLEEYGKNIIDTGNENSLAKRIREAIINPFNIVLLIGFTGIAGFLDLPVMVPSFALWLAGLMIVYTIFAQIMKRIYMKINHEWV